MVKFGSIGSYRFFFTTNDRDEAPHVHIERDGRVAKFWLKPVRVAKPDRFSGPELRRMERLVSESRADIIDVWNEFLRR